MFFTPTLGQTLEPTKHSLSELVYLPLCTSMTWPNHRLDLSNFGVLRVLEVTSSCLRRKPHLGRRRSGFYRCLPPSLQELRVRISSSLGFLESLMLIAFALCRLFATRNMTSWIITQKEIDDIEEREWMESERETTDTDAVSHCY